MYQKFIINQDGVLRFGHVYMHRDLLDFDETCPYGRQPGCHLALWTFIRLRCS